MTAAEMGMAIGLSIGVIVFVVVGSAYRSTMTMKELFMAIRKSIRESGLFTPHRVVGAIEIRSFQR